MTVAGREFRQTFEPQANLKHSFEWDGKDAYGREVVGAQNAEVRIGYVYPAEYLEPPSSRPASASSAARP